jgi:hypothetical protein
MAAGGQRSNRFPLSRRDGSHHSGAFDQRWARRGRRSTTSAASTAISASSASSASTAARRRTRPPIGSWPSSSAALRLWLATRSPGRPPARPALRSLMERSLPDPMAARTRPGISDSASSPAPSSTARICASAASPRQSPAARPDKAPRRTMRPRSLGAGTAIANARALIQVVPGEGPVRGVWFYGGSFYAFRDNVGAPLA